MALTANYNDPRKRHTHQSYEVTYGGLSPDSGAQGVTSLMPATYRAQFHMWVPGAAGTYLFNLPPHLYSSSYSIVVPGAAGTMTMTRLANGSGIGAPVVLAAALTAVDAIAYDAAYDADYDYDPTHNGQETIQVDVAGSPVNDILIVLNMGIVATGWK